MFRNLLWPIFDIAALITAALKEKYSTNQEEAFSENPF